MVLTDAKSVLEEFLFVYAELSRDDQREFAETLFAECNQTPEEIRATVVEYFERYGKSVRDIVIELACSEELSEREVSEAENSPRLPSS